MLVRKWDQWVQRHRHYMGPGLLTGMMRYREKLDPGRFEDYGSIVQAEAIGSTPSIFNSDVFKCSLFRGIPLMQSTTCQSDGLGHSTDHNDRTARQQLTRY